MKRSVTRVAQGIGAQGLLHKLVTKVVTQGIGAQGLLHKLVT
jgi:hypothetical protein